METAQSQNTSFLKSRALKISLSWMLFIVALFGTYVLSHTIESRTDNAAAAFLSSGTTHEVSLYQGKSDPAKVVARVGDEIHFVVKDDSRHNMAEERATRRDARIESGEFGQDESYSLSFGNRGTYSFYDRMNQDIHVTILVK